MRGTKVKELQLKLGRKKLTKAEKHQHNAQALTTASQQPKRVKLRKNKQAAGHGPTWPHTEDQKKQSRPVIYLRPVRALTIDAYLRTLPAEDGTRTISKTKVIQIQRAVRLPKYAIQALISK